MVSQKGDIVVWTAPIPSSTPVFREGWTAIVLNNVGTYSINVQWLTGDLAGQTRVVGKSRFKIVSRAEG